MLGEGVETQTSQVADAGPYGAEPARLQLCLGGHAPVPDGLSQIGLEVLQELANGRPEGGDREVDGDGLRLLLASELEKRLLDGQQLVLVEPRSIASIVHQSNP